VRIIGGTAGGQRLLTPRSDAIRPTADRVREALFDILSARYALPEGAKVLDLFAGTGALGLEALSRGAASAILVDQDRDACALAQKNAKKIGLADKTRVFCSDAAAFLRGAAGSGFTLALLDPPYEGGALAAALSALAGALGARAVVVVEHPGKAPPPDPPPGFRLDAAKRYGAAALAFFVREAETVAESPLSARARALKPPATFAISMRAKALARQGIDVVDFGLGEPDFATAPHIREAAKRALDQGITKYTEVAGVLPLREAISRRAERELGLPYSPQEVVVGVGAKQLLFNLALSVLEPGDEAIVAAPYWVSYPEHFELAGAKPVFVETSPDDGFLLDPDRLAAAMSPRTKLVVLNSPSNPTGAVLDLPRLRGIAEVLRRHPRALIAADEIYSAIHYGAGRAPSILHAAPDLRGRAIVVDGASKSYAMTGWRLGWALAPKEIADALSALQAQSTSNATSFAQAGLLAALEGDQSFVGEMVEEFRARRDLVLSGLRMLPGVSVATPGGAFYVFPGVSPYLGAERLKPFGEGSFGLAGYLLEEAHVAVVPGAAFGAGPYLRLSYALSREKIAEGLSRLARALAALKP
jgi:aspartate aminotransferase